MTSAKTWTMAALVAVLGLCGLAGTAWAADANEDSLTISITPNVDYGVDLDTATARFNTADSPGDLDIPLDLNTTAFLVSPATVTVTGNINNQELQVTAAGLDTWTVDTDETIGSNSVQVYALFAVNKSSRPLEAEFGQGGDGRHQIMFGGSSKIAGESSGSENNDLTGNVFEIADGSMTSGTNMDDLSVGNIKQLWLRLDTPSLTSVDTAQRIQVTVTAMTGVTN